MSFRKIQNRLRRIHPDHHLIANDMAWVALLVLIGKLAGAAKEAAIAYRFGITAEVDAYLFVFNLVTWPVGVWFSILAVVLVPLTVRIQQNDGNQLLQFNSELFGITIVFGAFLACIAWLGLPPLLSAFSTGLSVAVVNKAIDMIHILALLAPLGLIISLYSAWMLASGRHVNTLLESLPALTILGALTITSMGGTDALVWGTLIGFGFHLVALVTSLLQAGVICTPRFTFRSPHWTPFWQGFGITLVGQMMISLTIIVDQFFAAGLGTGAISILGYANRILALVMGIGALAVGRATLPIFSSIHAKDGEHVGRIAALWVRLLLMVGVAVLFVSWWLAPVGVKMIYEHGKFTAKDTVQVATVLRYGLIQIPFYFSGLVLVSLLASQRRYREIAAITLFGAIVKVSANIIFVPNLGISSLMISSSLMYASTTLLLSIVASKKLKMNVKNR